MKGALLNKIFNSFPFTEAVEGCVPMPF